MFKKLLKCLGIIFLFFVISFDFMFLMALKETEGNPVKAAVGMFKDVAKNVTNEEPLYVLLLGQNSDGGQTLTDTIICFGYNPKLGDSFLISIPRDTFVRKKYIKSKTRR